MTAGDFRDDDCAIDASLDHAGSHNPGADLKTRAALMLLDYCYVFMLATVPLLIGSRIVPDLSPSSMALQFFDRPHEHDGRRHIDRRAHVRFLSARFTTVAEELAGHPDAVPVDDRQGLGAAYRVGVEAHFSPFIDVLFHRTRLSRNALWRLVADAIAGRCLEVGRRLGCLEEAQAIGMEVVKQKGSPLYNRQLRYFDLTLHDDDRNPLGSWTFRARGGCCRFYTVTNGSLCSTCVLKNPAERDAELLQAMRAHAHLLVRGGK